MFRRYRQESPIPTTSHQNAHVEVIDTTNDNDSQQGSSKGGRRRSDEKRSPSRTPSPSKYALSPDPEKEDVPSTSLKKGSITKTNGVSNNGRSANMSVALFTTGNNNGMFDPSQRQDRKAPPLPDTNNVDYVRAASWAASSCNNVLSDDKGRALFRYFLFISLADENLAFLEAVEKLKKMKASDEKKAFAKEIVDTYGQYINLSSGAMKKIREAAVSDVVDNEDFAPAIKEVRRLLENDQFPRFRRSEVYLDYLEKLLPRSHAERWQSSFDAMLGNHVGRHHFRMFLQSVRAEENLRFWEAVVEFRGTKNKSQAMQNMARVILQTYLAEGTTNEVYLPFGVRQMIERRIEDKDVDIGIFDEAVKHVEQILRNDPYVRYLQSPQYAELLAKLGKNGR